MTRHWIRRPLIGLDLETTCTDVEAARIVTGSIVRWGGGQLTEAMTWTSHLDGMEIPAAATAVHKITTERARATGRAPAVVTREMVEVLASFASAGWPVVAMNAPFDLTILNRECERYGATSLERLPLFVLDPWVLDRHVDKYRKGPRRLIDLCNHYRVKLQGAAHSSEVDARAACGVVWKIAQRHRYLQATPLDELHEAQHHWAREQAESHRAYRLRKYGEEEQERPFGWPFIPRPDAVGAP